MSAKPSVSQPFFPAALGRALEPLEVAAVKGVSVLDEMVLWN